jgi:hypothetical protein
MLLNLLGGNVFNECGLIYLTKNAKQRNILLKLITLLGGNVMFKDKIFI